MTSPLPTFFEHANRVAQNQPNTEVYLNAGGEVSDRSGLGFFKRLFSSKARGREDAATLAAFRQSVENLMDATNMRSQSVSFFFRHKKEGTPLTAKEIMYVHHELRNQEVQLMRDRFQQLGYAEAFPAKFLSSAMGTMPGLAGNPVPNLAWMAAGNLARHAMPHEFMGEREGEPTYKAAIELLGGSAVMFRAGEKILRGEAAHPEGASPENHFLAHEAGDALAVMESLVRLEGRYDLSYIAQVSRGWFDVAVDAVHEGLITPDEAAAFVEANTGRVLSDTVQDELVAWATERSLEKALDAGPLSAERKTQVANHPAFLRQLTDELAKITPADGGRHGKTISETVADFTKNFVQTKIESITALTPEEFIATLPVTEKRITPTTRALQSPAEGQGLLNAVKGTSLKEPAAILQVLAGSRTAGKWLRILLLPGLPQVDKANALLEIGKWGLQAATKAGPEAPLAAFTLALDEMQLDQTQMKALYGLLTDDDGIMLGRSFTALAQEAGKDSPDQRQAATAATLQGGASSMETLRSLLGQRLQPPAGTGPSPYAAPAPMSAIAAPVYNMAERIAGLSTRHIRGQKSLGMLARKLTENEWNTLLPVMDMVAEGMGGRKTGNHDLESLQQMIAASAEELLKAGRDSNGELSPAVVWKTVLGDNVPFPDNPGKIFGAELLETAVDLLLKKAGTQGESENSMRSLAYGFVAHGIPFQTLLNAYQPGGKISHTDSRFLTFPTTLGGLGEDGHLFIKDFARLAPDAQGRPATTTIEDPAGRTSIAHHPMPPGSDHALYRDFMERCRNVCQSEMQFKRLMGALSQSGLADMSQAALLFSPITGGGIGEHGYFNTVVTPADGNIVVAINNGKDPHPIQKTVQYTIAPNGDMSLTDMEIVLVG